MSTITSHTLSCDNLNLEEELKKEGLVYSGTIRSRRRNEEISYDNILDYEKCCPELAKERIEALKEKGRQILKDNGEWVRHEYTEDELRDACKIPVYFTDNGNSMYWLINYGHNDYPANAISKRFPEQTFGYHCAIEEQPILDIKIKDAKEVERFSFLIGNIGTEPERKTIPTKNGEKTFTNAFFYAKGENGEQDKRIRITAWGEEGKRIGKMHKGDRLGVSGNVKTTEKNGNTYFDMTVNKITYEKSKEEPKKVKQEERI